MGDDRIHDALLAWVRNGRFLPGSRLPSLRTICALVKCTRHGAQQAVLALERDGLLVRRSPRVFTVAGHAPAPGELDRTLVVFANVHAMRPHVADPARARYTGGTPSALAGIEAAARAAGLTVNVFPPDPATLGRFAVIEKLRPFAWLFLNDIYGRDSGRRLLAAAQRSARPTAVWADSLLPDELAALPCDAVLADHRASAALLVDHLAARGCRRLLPIVLPGAEQAGGRDFAGVWMVERLAGYHEGARRAGIALLDPLPFLGRRYTVRRDLFDEGCMALAGVMAPALLADPPADGLLAPEDGTATALACAARRLGRELPVAGFDATWHDRAEAAWGPPPVASIDQQWGAIGAALVELVRQRSAQPRGGARQVRVPGLLTRPDEPRTNPMSGSQLAVASALVRKTLGLGLER
ncbi:MAG: substrate-binding domain-containing protein [Planctomycetes bacterium]|nr:substrate-binding domain-containing protein [Planctomycetota bacterium]